MNKLKLYLSLIGLLLIASMPKAWSYEDLTNVVVELVDIPDLSVTIRETHYGNIAVKGQTKVLGVTLYSNLASTKQCDITFAAFKNDGEVVQIYDGDKNVSLEANGSYELKVPCLINLPEGDYHFVPVIHFTGDSKWYICRRMTSVVKNGYWKLHVYEDYKAPSSDYMNLPDIEGKGDSEYSLYHFYQNEKFRVEMNLVNKRSEELRGKLKIVWERNMAKFWRGMSYEPDDITTEWQECASTLAYVGDTRAVNGAIPISIPANESLHLTIKDCYLGSYHDYGNRWSPRLCAYFLPEGSADTESNWLLVNENADFAFDDTVLKDNYGWDHGLNQLAFEIFEGSLSTERINIESIVFSYNRSVRMVTIEGLTDSGFIRVITMDGKLVETACSIVNGSSSFVLPSNGRIYIISIYDSDGMLVKSFKVLS